MRPRCIAGELLQKGLDDALPPKEGEARPSDKEHLTIGLILYSSCKGKKAIMLVHRPAPLQVSSMDLLRLCGLEAISAPHVRIVSLLAATVILRSPGSPSTTEISNSTRSRSIQVINSPDTQGKGSPQHNKSSKQIGRLSLSRG